MFKFVSRSLVDVADEADDLIESDFSFPKPHQSGLRDMFRKKSRVAVEEDDGEVEDLDSKRFKRNRKSFW